MLLRQLRGASSSALSSSGRDAIKPSYGRRPSDQPVKLTVGWRIPLTAASNRSTSKAAHAVAGTLNQTQPSTRPSRRCRLADMGSWTYLVNVIA